MATLSSKYQITVPAKVREALGMKPGDLVDIEVEGGHAVLRTAPKSDVLEVADSMKHYFAGKKVDVKKALAERVRKKYGRH